MKDPEPLTHAVLIHADPAGQHAAAVGTRSPSDCYPTGPVGPYVAGGPVGPGDCLQVLQPFEQVVLDYADPDGQHAVVLDTAEPLEHAVVENILNGRPMEGIMCAEYSLRLLDATLDGGLVEKIPDWEPEASQVPDTTLDSRLMEGITDLEHLAPGVSLDSGPMEGMSCLEPLEQLIFHSSWIARPSICVMEERSERKPVINPVISYTLDSLPMEGITYLERSALGVSLDSEPTEGASCLEPLEQSVLSSSLAARPVEGVTEKVSDWKPVINPVMSYTLDSRLMEGNTYLERSALGVSLDSGPMEGASSLEPLEQLVLGSSLAARPIEGNMMKVSDWKPVIKLV